MLGVEGYSLLTGKQGLIGYLFNQLENGEPGSETVSLDLSVTKGVFAARLNLTEQTIDPSTAPRRYGKS
ncbi:MAG: hypothetical protein KAX99_10715 [Azonexus sp.]|jgi:hypothetical protein|nr:hypothetical protein [Azonexus sp.]MBP9229483.1 hypothetical protein [Azonexus sp.]HRC60376.1 hypothetical protein [Candidatus Propionivibrio aalborgensis]